MKRLFRKLMLALVMVAIPFQGFAAVTMLFCGADQAHHVSAEHEATDQSLHGKHVSDASHQHAQTSDVKSSHCISGVFSLPHDSAIMASIAPANSHVISFASSSQPHYFSEGPLRPPRVALA